MLDEVVVVGYGVQKKKLVTGATVQVKGDEIAKMNTTNPLQAMQGQTPGVSIASTSGQPGADMKVSIRGLGTVGNSAPLYLIDGVGGDISTLNPADIESIDAVSYTHLDVYKRQVTETFTETFWLFQYFLLLLSSGNEL